MLRKFSTKGRTYFQLRISCPVCIDRGHNSPRSYWVHYDCGGTMFIGDNAHFSCVECDQNNHVRNWSFNCPFHTNTEERTLKYSNRTGVAQAVSTAAQMVHDTGHRWLIEFMTNY